MSVLKEQILLLLFWVTTSLLDILRLTPPSRLEDLNENNKKVRDEYGQTKSESALFLFTPWFDDHQLWRRKLSIRNATSPKFVLNFRKLLHT